MPCEGPYVDHYGEAKRELNKVTQLLCGIMGVVNPEFAEHLFSRVPGLREWHEEHRRADQERERREQAQREHQAQHAQALKKLTPAERKVLGL